MAQRIHEIFWSLTIAYIFHYFQALDLFKKSCDMDRNPEPEGCHRYASMLLVGFKDIIQRDPAKALPYASKACDMGMAQGLSLIHI